MVITFYLKYIVPYLTLLSKKTTFI